MHLSKAFLGITVEGGRHLFKMIKLEAIIKIPFT